MAENNQINSIGESNLSDEMSSISENNDIDCKLEEKPVLKVLDLENEKDLGETPGIENGSSDELVMLLPQSNNPNSELAKIINISEENNLISGVEEHSSTHVNNDEKGLDENSTNNDIETIQMSKLQMSTNTSTGDLSANQNSNSDTKQDESGNTFLDNSNEEMNSKNNSNKEKTDIDSQSKDDLDGNSYSTKLSEDKNSIVENQIESLNKMNKNIDDEFKDKLNLTKENKLDLIKSSDVNQNKDVTDSDLHTSDVIRQIDNDDIKCGFASCTPSWAQIFASKYVYIILYCIIGVVNRMYYTYTTATLSTIEKRFNFSSKWSGLILVGDDISQLFFVLILTYFGNYSHRPRLMGLGTLFVAASCFLSTLPHFIYGAGKEAEDLARANSIGNSTLDNISDISEEMCGINEEVCDDESTSSSATMYGPIIMFFLAQCCEGLSSSVFHTIGNTYLDDNVEKKKYPIFFSMSLLLRVMGPVMGFIVAGKCLSVWIDPSNPASLSNKDPRWLGAWWIGFLGGGIILSIVGITIMFFPKQLPEAFYREVKRVQIKLKEKKEEITNENIMKVIKKKKQKTKPTIKKFPTAVKRLFTNKLWLAATFDLTVFLLAGVGYWTFKPKYLEAQFRKSASSASFWTGTVSLISSTVGISIGGIVLRWIRPSAKIVTGYSLFLAFVASASMIGLAFVSCPPLNIIGPNTADTSGLTDCNRDCNCTLKFSPVCSEDKVTVFYSPCYAGCAGAESYDKTANFTDCKCIKKTHGPEFYNEEPTMLENTGDSIWGGNATRGYCDEDCNAFNTYLIISTIWGVFGASGRVSGTMIFFRIVRPEDKALGAGLVSVMLSLFAFIPGPLIMGAVVDSTCLIWKESCGNKGNCYQYDTDKFRLVLHIVPGVLFLISSLGDYYIFKHSDKLKLYAEDDEQEAEEVVGDPEEKEAFL